MRIKHCNWIDTIAEGHIAKASAYLFYEWNWEEAYEELQKALRLNPGCVEAYELLGFYYIMMGEKEKAVETLEEAEQIGSALPAGIIQSLGNMYIFAERYDDAIRQADKLLEMNPRCASAIEMKGWATGMKGDWE